MQRAEMRDSGALLGTALDELTVLTRDVHKALAGRLFGLLGPKVAPVRLLHDAISATAYGGARIGAKVLPRVAGVVAAETTKPSTESIDDSVSPYSSSCIGLASTRTDG